MKLIKTKDTTVLEVTYTHPDTGSMNETYVIQCDDVYEFLGSRNNEYVQNIIEQLKQEWKANHSYYHTMKVEQVIVYQNEIFRTTLYDSDLE